ncbi:MAG TPA: T9SS type A sorting domain-containing protein [Bacteroidia bacterium]|nr:T9SS type A sorting domain-containing protein [Bacteroidia bacterium]
MKKTMLSLLMLAMSLCMSAQVSTRLNIPPRIQWPNNDGYCGENSIQMCGLYYGDYISEGLCRNVAGGELLIYVNDTIALNTLSFNYVEWDPNGASPQYSSYLDWVKQYLNKKQPVIITVYVSGMGDPDYDHIIPAIGFNAKSIGTYTSTDSLTYNSNFDTMPFTRIFSTLYGTRGVANNSAPFPYYVPQNVDYGVVVTGNKDPGHVTRPVHIVLDSNDEPNVSLGAKPRMMKAQVIADSLTIGKSYALIRYNNYKTVPSTGFNPLTGNSAVYFTASAITQTVVDSFMSDTAVFYRCIPYTVTGINQAIISSDNYFVYPNPSTGNFTVQLPDNTEQIEVIDAIGRLIKKANVQSMKLSDMYLPEKGIYFIRTSGKGAVHTCKVVITN